MSSVNTSVNGKSRVNKQQQAEAAAAAANEAAGQAAAEPQQEQQPQQPPKLSLKERVAQRRATQQLVSPINVMIAATKGVTETLTELKATVSSRVIDAKGRVISMKGLDLDLDDDLLDSDGAYAVLGELEADPKLFTEHCKVFKSGQAMWADPDKKHRVSYVVPKE